jgi:hypothetical protein
MLDAGTIEAILVLYIRCPASEKSSMAGFLGHHAKFSNAASEMVRSFHIPYRNTKRLLTTFRLAGSPIFG